MTENQIRQAMEVARAIWQLEQSEGWTHFKQAAELMIQQKSPYVETFKPEEATIIASKMAHIGGMRAALNIPRAAKKRYQDLEKQLAQTQARAEKPNKTRAKKI